MLKKTNCFGNAVEKANSDIEFINNVAYRLTDGYYEVIGIVDGYTGPAVGILGELNGITVKKIADNAFNENQFIKEVSIGDGVEVIGAAAFKGTRLSRLTLPGSLRRIRSSAFCYIHTLEEVSFNQLTHGEGLGIDIAAFSCCGLSGITFVNGTRFIDYDVLRGNDSLEFISIPATVTDFDDSRIFASLKVLEIISTDPYLVGKIIRNIKSRLDLKIRVSNDLPSNFFERYSSEYNLEVIV